ncbi:MAG TPA: methyltransferase domain-containing protein [Verrucomicrobiae bacterium]|nr:methyltransferase domain-containing protein [Verrucomicrobiae bacterium]
MSREETLGKSRVIGEAKAVARVREDDQPVCLNLGSGPFVLPGWLSIDFSISARLSRFSLLRAISVRVGKWPEGILCYDLAKPLPFPPCGVDAIFSSHTLEHLQLRKAAELVKDCYRILARGGILRIIVPDGTNSVLRGQCSPISLESLFDGSVFDSRPDLAAINNYGDGVKPWELRFPFLSWLSVHYHRWAYDEASLRAVFEWAGFRDVLRKGCHDSRIPDIEVLEDPSRNNEFALCLEAVK